MLDASGYVVARRQAVVSSKIPGKIPEVLVEEGVRVVKDQIVAYLDNSSQTAQLRLAQAQHRSAEAALNEISAQLRQAELDLTRASELLARKLTSQAEFDFAVTPDLLVQGLIAAIIIGLVGGLIPAIRAVRIPVSVALREL